MSRGAGRVEQGIIAAFAADSDNAFTITELCCQIYPDSEYIEKKHTVAILRAAKSLSKRWPDLGWRQSEMRGRETIFFNAASVVSHAMGRLKGDKYEWHGEAWMRASLLPGGDNHDRVVEGGAWRRHRDMWIAERDGDTAALERLNAEQEQSMNEIASLLRSVAPSSVR